MKIECIGKPGDTVEFDTGAEKFAIPGPVPLLRAFVASAMTTLEFVPRSDVGRLELIGLKVWKNWQEATQNIARRGHPIALHCQSFSVTEADRRDNILTLSAMDAFNACCFCFTFHPEWSDRRHARWQRSLFADTGNDAPEALWTAWAAIHWPDHPNPEVGARMQNVLKHYPADVAGYRAAAS